MLDYDVLRGGFETLAAAASASASTVAAAPFILCLTARAGVERRDDLEAAVSVRSEGSTRENGLENWPHDGQAGADYAYVAFDKEPDAGVDDCPCNNC